MSETRSILSNCTSGGCGAKIGAGELAPILAGLARLQSRVDDRLIVGFDASDDASVYRLDDTYSLISTVDFFSPMTEDARSFGRIAAANAMSDVWAMGGRPLLALNLVCFPEAMGVEILGEILVGGAEKISEAGAVLGGGHSIYDKEPKYGLAVTGIVETAKVRRNNTPAPGHRLILTKPLGVGIIMAAARGGVADEAAVRKALASMERLNRSAGERMASFDVSACTDVTGYGLLTHALEMAGDSASLLLFTDAIPLLPEAVDYANEYLLTAAGQRNRNFAGERAEVDFLPFALQELMFDPQTSGGLLIAVSLDQAEELLASIRGGGDESAAIVGEVMARDGCAVVFE
ncbi:MAG: selenide, water dikinase SelD [Synergistaceae bacterium]|jgi:selenide,water dikinase|nr:selenide, water dikinase SelD [Synergistaceae bacterium]